MLVWLEPSLGSPKSFNFVVSPGLIAGGAFRRAPHPHRSSNMARPLLYQQSSTMLLDLPQDGLSKATIYPPSLRPELPFEWHNKIRVIGVYFDSLLTFREHLQALLARARIRQGVITGLAHSSLRTTHNTLLASLTRFGLATAGSDAFGADLKRLEARHANVAVRRVLGVNPTARLDAVFSAADLLSVRNLFLRPCAAMLERGLRASDCTFLRRLNSWTAGVYNVSKWDSRPEWLSLSRPLGVLAWGNGRTKNIRLRMSGSAICCQLPRFIHTVSLRRVHSSLMPQK